MLRPCSTILFPQADTHAIVFTETTIEIVCYVGDNKVGPSSGSDGGRIRPTDVPKAAPFGKSDMTPIDLNDVALFTKVVETGSFTAAARALVMQKATVSRRVAQLEGRLGTRLLDRTTRKIELTALGRAYFEEVSRGLSAFDAARERLAAAQAEPSGTLRVTAPVGFGTRSLIGWIAEFLALNDKVRIELKLSDEPVDPIDARVDLAFRTDRLPNSSQIARKLGSTRLILVATPAYLERRRTPERIEDLEQHDCIIFGPSADAQVWRLEGPEGWCEIPVSGRIAVEGSHAELQAALASLGVALLPVALTASHLRARELRQVLPDYGVDRGELHAVYASNRHMPASLRAFLDFVVEKSMVRKD